MIQQFRCQETERVFHRQFSKIIPQKLLRNAYKKLKLLNAATTLIDLTIPPGNRLEKLKGKRKDQYSIRINDQWRICFEWKVNHAYEVEIIDYH